MTRPILWAKRAADELRRLDRVTAQRIGRAVERYAEAEYGDVRRLRGSDDELRLRVGDWRVRFRVNSDTGAIEVLRVLPRGRAYRD